MFVLSINSCRSASVTWGDCKRLAVAGQCFHKNKSPVLAVRLVCLTVYLLNLICASGCVCSGPQDNEQHGGKIGNLVRDRKTSRTCSNSSSLKSGIRSNHSAVSSNRPINLIRKAIWSFHDSSLLLLFLAWTDFYKSGSCLAGNSSQRDNTFIDFPFWCFVRV